MKQAGWRFVLKRGLDLSVASLALILLSPAMAFVALSIRTFMGSPVLFRQQRPGREGKPFVLYKFRTMLNLQDAHGRHLSDEHRLTAFGRFLRGTSLDELPQFWNILRGELSLVGPRPLLMQYLDRYTARQARRHEVLPGITGWAQINGRNDLSWDKKFDYDIWYVDNWTLKMDLLILFRTFFRVVKREGISRADHATMPEFLGNKKSDS
jgi:lipopolysaccharide/colanic/teichoic acid biosynthesis glycosyltransferase